MNKKNIAVNLTIIAVSIAVAFLYACLQVIDDVEFQQQSSEEREGQLMGIAVSYGLIIASGGIMAKRIIIKIKNKKKPRLDSKSDA